MAGVYIHIPFCRKICSYCDFYHSASLSRSDALFASLLSEMQQRSDYLGEVVPTTLYFGGGTPTVMSVEQLRELKSRACELFGIKVIEEFTVEANPEDLSWDYLRGLKDIGVNRLSIGIQSLDDDILKFMNRSHSASEAVEAVKRAREVGFSNISLDLIFGVPGLDIKTLEWQVREIMALGSTHISAYHLTIDRGSILYKQLERGRFKEIDDRESSEHYALVHRLLEEGGFRHYEVSNYAKEGMEARHNSGYWSGEPYIGIGPSAHSFDGVSRQANVASLRAYIEAIESGEHYYEVEQLSAQDHMNEYIMTSLRQAKGIELERFSGLFGEQNTKQLLSRAAPMVKLGSLELTHDRLYIDSQNFLISDAIISELFSV